MRNTADVNALITKACLEMHSQGTPYKEIAKIIGISQTSVWKRLRKAGVPLHSHGGDNKFPRPYEPEYHMIARALLNGTDYRHVSKKDAQDIRQLAKSMPVAGRILRRNGPHSTDFRSSMQNVGS